MIIAIDGYSSTGKSTMARQLAKALGYRYIDSGAMYRAVTLYALRHSLITGSGALLEADIINALPDIKIDFKINDDGKQSTCLNGEDVEHDIREMEVSRFVSLIAAIPAVRHEMVRQQRVLGESGGIVMDGRDIGTTVFPNAGLKIFVTASADIRAKRRYDELLTKGEQVEYNDVLENVRQRDYIDEHREVSPLRRADDAVLLDNSEMSIERQNQWLLDLVRGRIHDLGLS